jgi:hypothetical protein
MAQVINASQAHPRSITDGYEDWALLVGVLKKPV